MKKLILILVGGLLAWYFLIKKKIDTNTAEDSTGETSVFLKSGLLPTSATAATSSSSSTTTSSGTSSTPVSTTPPSSYVGGGRIAADSASAFSFNQGKKTAFL